MRYFIVLGLVSLLVGVVVELDNFDKDSHGLFQMFVINIGVAALLFVINRYKEIRFRYILLTLIGINIAMLFNASGFSSSSMSASHYVIPYFQDATDFMMILLMFSAFLLFIPLIVYGLFVYSLAKIVVMRKEEVTS